MLSPQATIPPSGSDISKPHTHLVHFYENDMLLVESIGRFAHLALSSGDCAAIIATPEHCASLLAEFRARGVDVEAVIREGRYVALDAQATLEKFMVEGWPDESRFNELLLPVFKALHAINNGQGKVLAFGEMVAILWQAGKRDAAIRLEQLWNKLADSVEFALYCAYPSKCFEDDNDRKLFFSVCGEHSHVNPFEAPTVASDAQRERLFAAAQLRNKALEQALRLSQERIMLMQRAAAVGTWEMDIFDDTFSFSWKAAKLLGLATTSIRLSEFLQLMFFSGDRETFVAGLERARGRGKEFVTEFRVQRHGETRILSIRGKTFFNSNQPIILGVIAEVTDTHVKNSA